MRRSKNTASQPSGSATLQAVFDQHRGAAMGSNGYSDTLPGSWVVKESQIEDRLVAKLRDLKYAYRPEICDRDTLEQNFRKHFEALNRVRLTDAEFARLRDEIINPDVFQASRALRENGYFQREDGTPLHYMLVNLKDWCKNEFEVINQLRINTDNSHHRYDVILLINGLPLVQIELKTLDIHPRRAMEQIVGYRNDPGNGYTNTLLCFVQMFIVSNFTNTYYFANNHSRHFVFNAAERFLPVYQWARKDNSKITHLDDFVEEFLPKCTLGQMISRYMVLVASEQKLMVMRPYQIYAVQAIVDCIQQNRGNGYVWHTTGSGKTLTSFKASTLLKDNSDIEKCLFVVDRKDLDRQTRLEFNKFQEGCVEENTNTETLVRRLLSEDRADKVIVSTIQKLGLALDETNERAQQHKRRGNLTYRQRLAPLRDKRIVIIFDECHRSQFGENHEAIKEFFPQAQLFGFTGTPIFGDNANYNQISGTVASRKTTKDIFQKELHAYTITHAINDRNVLRFHVDYFKPKGESNAKPSRTVTQQAVVKRILDKHDVATSNRRFNALLATTSINDAIGYYDLFKREQSKRSKQQTEKLGCRPINIACVFSPPAEGNKDVQQLQEDLLQEQIDNKQEPEKKKNALKQIIADYNVQYKTNHSLGEFDRYYQDVQKRIKDQQYPNSDVPYQDKIDITIVVDMLLTGFDSKYLNTLYVDKNLRYHGLIQAFSRTNRVLNDTKPYGNILDFRSQQTAVDEAIALFSGEEDKNYSRQIWLVESADKVIKKYETAVVEMKQFISTNSVGNDQADDRVRESEKIYNLKGNAARVKFVKLFKEVQRLKTQLDQYTDLKKPQEKKIETLLPPNDLRVLRGSYLETAQRLREEQGKTDNSTDQNQNDIEEAEFNLVLFSSALIDYDYIMSLITRYSQENPDKQTMSREDLIDELSSSSNLMEERDDIAAYINTLEAGKGLNEQAIRDDYQAFKERQIQARLTELAETHNLAHDTLYRFVDTILDRYIFDGDQLSDLFEPLDLGWKARIEAELALMKELTPLLKKQANGRTISGLEAYE